MGGAGGLSGLGAHREALYTPVGQQVGCENRRQKWGSKYFRPPLPTLFHPFPKLSSGITVLSGRAIITHLLLGEVRLTMRAGSAACSPLL